jgi:hypothetical protein
MEEPRRCPKCKAVLEVYEYRGFDCQIQLIHSRSYVCLACDDSKVIARETEVISGPFLCQLGPRTAATRHHRPPRATTESTPTTPD